MMTMQEQRTLLILPTHVASEQKPAFLHLTNLGPQPTPYALKQHDLIDSYRPMSKEVLVKLRRAISCRIRIGVAQLGV
jgi:hypothetical protein